MPVRQYSSIAQLMDLVAGINDVQTSMQVNSTAGLPGATPYVLAIDKDAVTEELVEVTAVSGTTLTITRAIDGTSGVAHSAGSGTVRHVFIGEDARLMAIHIAAVTAAHGIGGRFVGDVDTQTLSNKTIDGDDNTLLNIPTSAFTGVADKANLPTDTVYLATAQTLTNKTLTAPAISAPTGIVKADVGLGSVDNTTDAAKPVSTAQATALALKANLAAPSFTGGVAVAGTLAAANDLTVGGNAAVTGNETVGGTLGVTGVVTVTATVVNSHIPKEVLAIRVSATTVGIAAGGTATSSGFLFSAYTTKTFAHAPVGIITMASQPGGSAMVVPRLANITTTGFDILTNNCGSGTAVFTGCEYDIVFFEASAAAAVG